MLVRYQHIRILFVAALCIFLFLPWQSAQALPLASKILFSENNDVYVMDSDGENEVNLTDDDGESGSWPIMTADQASIIYMDNGDLYRMDADGNNKTNLTNTLEVGEYSPSVSANGSKVVYTGEPDGSGNKDVYIMDIDGSNQTRLTTNAAEDQWAMVSPDATKIVFTSRRDNDDYEIYIMNADGSNQTRLTNSSGQDAYPAFSPDGQTIVFYSERSGGAKLFTMDIDGSNPTILGGDTPVDGAYPTYNYDGTKILYGNGSINTVDANGANITVIRPSGNYPHFSMYAPIALDEDAPEFVDEVTTSSITSQGITINWTTDEEAYSKVSYGLTSSYSTSTSETDAPVTVHEISLSNLLACTVYHYAAVSTDEASNTATSTDSTFTTSGCAGGAVPSSATTTSILVSNAATSTLTDTGRTFTIATPMNFTATSSSVVIQIKGLDSDTVLGSIGKPLMSLASAASIVFDVTALIDNTTILDSFDVPVTISYTYTDQDVNGLDENSLSMYHYHNAAWLPLDDCSVYTSTNTITCNAPNFSTFAIFGTAQTISPEINTSRSGSSRSSARRVVVGTTLCPYYHFDRLLRFGDKGEDVRALQQFLNCAGFSLGANGPGSIGNETVNFSDRTLSSVKAYQEAYSSDILAPIESARPTGIFATYSQKKAYSLMLLQ